MTEASVLDSPPVEVVSTEFEIPRKDWFEILDDVLPFAAPADNWSLPWLASVQIRVSEPGLITVATTDRFCVGRRRYQLEKHTGNAVEILLPTAEVKALRRIHAPAPRGTEDLITVALSGKSVRDGANIGEATGSGGSITVTSRKGAVVSSHDGFDSTFLDLDKFLPDEVKTEPIDRISWNPEYMAKFAKVKNNTGRNITVRFESVSRPIRIDIGENFSGAIMPARLAS